MRFYRLKIILAMGLILGLLCGSGAAWGKGLREVWATNLNFRAGPSTKYKSYGLLPKGTLVELLKIEPYWCKVRLGDGREGYVYRKYLAYINENSWRPIARGWINGNSVNLRCGPGLNYGVKAQANKGRAVEILKRMGKWYCVRVKGASTVWVAGWLVKVEGKGVVISPPGEQKSKFPPRIPAEGIVKTAKKYLGRPYRGGGTTSGGFDCSGFVYRVILENGRKLPRTASGQFKVGMIIARRNLRAGDVVFFGRGSKKRIFHVGIYLGSGRMVHASSARGRVLITSLNKRFYARRYAGARRM